MHKYIFLCLLVAGCSGNIGSQSDAGDGDAIADAYDGGGDDSSNGDDAGGGDDASNGTDEGPCIDIDNDGRDEIFLGGTAIGPDGRVLYCVQSGGHIDDCEAADFVPARPGLEVIYAQERGADAVLLCDKKGLIWERVSGEEPQMFVVGDFYPEVPGAEAFCPARGETRPFIISGTGEFVVGFGDATNSGQPSPYPLGWDWHLRGRVEEKTKAHWGHVINATDFDGDGFDELLVVRDEGTELVKPTTWEVVFRVEGITGQTKLAQVVGDAREELIIIRDGKCYIWTAPPMSPSAGQRLRGAR